MQWMKRTFTKKSNEVYLQPITRVGREESEAEHQQAPQNVLCGHLDATRGKECPRRVKIIHTVTVGVCDTRSRGRV